ncbi:hypothetical protein M758_4G237100 [Ceratodon purpureus]|nr:hypothetical protein M758_4G237100 [Ceratodon purpureus]
MSHARKLRGGSVKGYNSDLCDECDSAAKHGSGSKLSQGTYKSDVVSDAVSKRTDDKENLSDDRKVLLALTVEIEDGCVERIQLKEGDSAEAVAIKFCIDHALPEQFVAPLTEHIVNNIISISKEDSDIVFNSQEEGMSNNENSTLRGGASYSPRVNNRPESPTKSRVYGRRPASAESNAMLARRERRKMDVPPNTLQASQKVNRSPVCCSPMCGNRPRKKTRRRKRRKSFSDRLIGPTITSLAKIGALDCMHKSKTRIRPLSEQAKAVCMRLSTEHLGQTHRCRDEVKRSNTFCKENIARSREPGLSKRSWWLSRMRGKFAKQFRNYGELLYAEGLTKRQNHIKAVRERAEQLESRELAEVTLRPKISKRSRNMKRNQNQVWRRLQSDDRPKQDQLQELRQEVWEAKLMECTFRPRINQKRRTDSQDQYGDYYSNRFEQLFLDAESRRRRQAERMQWHPEGVTFQPAINRGIPYGTSLMDDDCLQERSVFRRLVDNATKLMEKKHKLEQFSQRPFDPRTGRELFKPHIGRKPFNVQCYLSPLQSSCG